MKESYTDYENLNQNDEEESQTIPRPARRRSWPQIIGLTTLILIMTLVGVAIGSTRPLKLHWHSKPKVTSCGHTSREAIAAGCVLEPMVYGWMAPECQYPSISTKHDPWSKWTWYSDENMTQPLSLEQLEKGESLHLWTNRGGYHLEHCLFLYEKLMYAVENRVEWIDKKTLAAHHAFHCAEQLETSVEAWNATTWTGLAIYECVRAPWA